MGLGWSTDGRISSRSEIASLYFPLNVSFFGEKSVILQKCSKVVFGREAG